MSLHSDPGQIFPLLWSSVPFFFVQVWLPLWPGTARKYFGRWEPSEALKNGWSLVRLSRKGGHSRYRQV